MLEVMAVPQRTHSITSQITSNSNHGGAVVSALASSVKKDERKTNASVCTNHVPPGEISYSPTFGMAVYILPLGASAHPPCIEDSYT
jgi:hypothetical protein